MAEFYTVLDSKNIAEQITDMINTYNRWARVFSVNSVMNTQARYFVEIVLDKVVGCSSIVQTHPAFSKVQHVCVLPQYRGAGLGKKLTAIAVNNCTTEYVYMTIRSDNIASIKMALSLEFEYAQKHWFRDHWTYTYTRKKLLRKGDIHASRESM